MNDNPKSHGSHDKSHGSLSMQYTDILHKSHGTYIDISEIYEEAKRARNIKAKAPAYALSIPKEFLEKFTDLPISKAQKFYERYLDAVRKNLMKLICFSDNGFVNFPLKKAFTMAGEFNYKNKRCYVWKEFFQLQPFFVIHNIGSNHKKENSEVYINHTYVNLLVDTSDREQLVQLYYHGTDVEKYQVVDLDIKSLKGYIEKTEIDIKLANHDNIKKTLCKNLYQAKQILLISEFFYQAYGKYVLPHVPNKSLYGRTYYKGINLQNCHKYVRAAALGDHYTYDLNASVYAVKLYLAIDICKDKNINDFGMFTYTKEYLEYKSMIRDRLAEHIQHYPDKLKLVKEAMTAIGFGARINGGVWRDQHNNDVFPAINGIIKNPDDRKRFLDDYWVKQFVKEQHELTRFITNHYLEIPEFIKKIENIPDIKNSQTGKYRKIQIMSYLYQQAETMIMDACTENIEYMIKIHDCFITKKPVHNQSLLDIKQLLNDTSIYFTLTTEFIKGWESYDYDLEIYEHEQRIKQEEQVAKNIGYNTMKLPALLQQAIKKQTEYYDGNNHDGSMHEYYDSDRDEELRFMTKEERMEHYRILGINGR